MQSVLGPADKAITHDFAMGVTAPGAVGFLKRLGLDSVVRGDRVLLAERHLRDPNALAEADLLQLRDAARLALPSHDEQFCSYWWTANVFEPLTTGALTAPPGLSSSEELALLEMARDIAEEDERLQQELDHVASAHGRGGVPTEDSPYTVVWAIADKARFSMTFRRLRSALSADSVERLVAWARAIAHAQGISLPPLHDLDSGDPGGPQIHV